MRYIVNGVYVDAISNEGAPFNIENGVAANRIDMVLFGVRSYSPGMTPGMRALSNEETEAAIAAMRKLKAHREGASVALEDAEWRIAKHCVASVFPNAVHAHWQGPSVNRIMDEALTEEP